MKEKILLTLKKEDFTNVGIDIKSLNPQLLERIIEELKERVNHEFQTELSIVYSMITRDYTQVTYIIWQGKQGFRITQNTTSLTEEEAEKVALAYEEDVWDRETEIEVDGKSEELTLYRQIDNSHPDMIEVTLEMPEKHWIAIANKISIA